MSPAEVRGYAAMFGVAAEENQQNQTWLGGAVVAPVAPKPTNRHRVKKGGERILPDPAGQGNVLSVLAAADAPFREALGSYVDTLGGALANSAANLNWAADYFVAADEENRIEIDDAGGVDTGGQHREGTRGARNAILGLLRNPHWKVRDSLLSGSTYDPFVNEKQFLKNFGMDVDEVVWKFSGDWAGLLACAYSYRHVARGLQSISDNVQRGNARLHRTWEGETGAAVFAHHARLQTDLMRLAPTLVDVANAHDNCVDAVSQIAETLAFNLTGILQEAAIVAAVAPEFASADFSKGLQPSHGSGVADFFDSLWTGLKGGGRGGHHRPDDVI